MGERPIRRDGRAILDQEREAGVRSTAAPVRDAAGLDEDRARDWVVVRMIHNAWWAVIDGDPDDDYLTMCFTVAKAVQD